MSDDYAAWDESFAMGDYGDLYSSAPDTSTYSAPAVTTTPGGSTSDSSFSWLNDVLGAAKTAAAYLAKGYVAKVADKAKLPNSPAQVQTSVKSWVWWGVGVAAVVALLVVVVKKARA